MKASKIFSLTCLQVATAFSSIANASDVASLDKVFSNQSASFIGRAFDIETRELLYVEKHHVTQFDNNGTSNASSNKAGSKVNIKAGNKANNKKSLASHQPADRFDNQMEILVEYYSPTGDQIGIKHSLFKPNQHTSPTFTMIDFRDNYFEFAKTQNERIQLNLFEEGNQQKKKIKIENASTLVVDSGFDRFLRKNWETIISGKTVQFDFAAPSQLDVISFKLELENVNEETVTLLMSIDNAFLAWLLDPIELTYNKTNKNILSYKGLTNVRDEKGKTLTAHILYEYPEVKHVSLK